MPYYLIKGFDRETQSPKSTTIHADSEVLAMREANMIVELVREIDPPMIDKRSCDNCGREVGKLETLTRVGPHDLCDECAARLSRQVHGGAFLDPESNKKAGAVLFRVIFWIISGLIIIGLISMIQNT